MNETATPAAVGANEPRLQDDLDLFLDALGAHAATATGQINASVHDLPLDIFGQLAENLDAVHLHRLDDGRFYLVGKQRFGRFAVTVFSDYFTSKASDLEQQTVADFDRVAAAAGLEVPVRARASNAAPRTGNLEHPNLEHFDEVTV